MQTSDKERSSTRETILRVMHKVAIDGTLGAACGGLYGLLYGGFGAHLHGDAWKLVSIALHFAGWGISAGTLVGAYAAFFTSDGESVGPTRSSQDRAATKDVAIEALRHLAISSHHAVHHGLASAARLERKQTHTVGA